MIYSYQNISWKNNRVLRILNPPENCPWGKGNENLRPMNKNGFLILFSRFLSSSLFVFLLLFIHYLWLFRISFKNVRFMPEKAFEHTHGRTCSRRFVPDRGALTPSIINKEISELVWGTHAPRNKRFLFLFLITKQNQNSDLTLP